MRQGERLMEICATAHAERSIATQNTGPPPPPPPPPPPTDHVSPNVSSEADLNSLANFGVLNDELCRDHHLSLFTDAQWTGTPAQMPSPGSALVRSLDFDEFGWQTPKALHTDVRVTPIQDHDTLSEDLPPHAYQELWVTMCQCQMSHQADNVVRTDTHSTLIERTAVVS